MKPTPAITTPLPPTHHSQHPPTPSMNATDQANLLSSLTLMKALKELIICEGRALFSPQHPLGHAYDVVVSKTRSHGSVVDEYEARLILYTGTPPAVVYSESVALLANPCRCESPVDAMVDLLEGLYECAGRWVKGAGAGSE